MILKNIYEQIITKLKDGGIAEAENEARIILRECAQVDYMTILSHPETELQDAVTTRISSIIDRRLRREPLQYIFGSWNFMGLDFFVEPEVLIPRSDTEILVEETLQVLHDGMGVLDLCTGTGCVLISLLKYSNDCSGTGVDISEHAVNLAKKNVDSILGSQADASIVLANLYEGADGKYDIIVSNPPYINTDVIETLEPEVKEYEPHLALDGGVDGMDLIREIISGAKEFLIPGGSLLMEIGYDQGKRVCDCMEKEGFVQVECVKDYAGLDRVVKGILPIDLT